MAVKKRGLGKGLDSMIPSYPKNNEDNEASLSGKQNKKTERGVRNTSDHDREPEDGEVIRVRISKIEPNREQPRQTFDEEALSELADSIKQYGLIQPLVVKKKGEVYEIIAGERRWRASRMAGLKEVPVLVREVSEQESMELALIENIQRENLNPMEEAKAYKRLLDEFDLTQEEMAKKVSRSRAVIANSMRLLKLESSVQTLVEEGKLSAGHARALVALADPQQQVEAAQRILEQELSVRDTEKLVKKLMNEAEREPKGENQENNEALELIYRQMEDKMEASLGTKVTICSGKNKKGHIQINYYSMDELERIFELLKQFGTHSDSLEG